MGTHTIKVKAAHIIQGDRIEGRKVIGFFTDPLRKGKIGIVLDDGGDHMRYFLPSKMVEIELLELPSP